VARPYKPWYRKPRDTWYVEIAGHQHPLCKGKDNRALAYQEMNRLLAQEEGPTNEAEKKTVVALFAKFLGWTKRHRAAQTYDQHRHFLKSFVSDPKRRRLAAYRVTIDVVETWLDENAGWKKSRPHAIRTLLRAFNWGVRRQLLPKNPIIGIEVPGKSRVVNYLSREQRETVRPSHGRQSPQGVEATGEELVAGEHSTSGIARSANRSTLSAGALAVHLLLAEQRPRGHPPGGSCFRCAPYLCPSVGCARNAMANRFHPLIATTARGTLTSYASPKCFRTSS